MPALPWQAARCVYLRLSDAYGAEASEAGALGWPVCRLESSHLGTMTDPRGLAQALDELAAQIAT